jgi:hypothetical protein
MSIKNVLFIFLAVSFSNVVLANASVKVKQFKDLKKISLKCHIELVGGKDLVITHYDLPKRDQDKFASILLKRGVSQQGKIKSVYKVNECVEINKKFKDLKINQMMEEAEKNM